MTRELTHFERLAAEALCNARHPDPVAEESSCPTCRADIVRLVDGTPSTRWQDSEKVKAAWQNVADARHTHHLPDTFPLALDTLCSAVAEAVSVPPEAERWVPAPDCVSPSQCAAIHAEGGDYVCSRCRERSASASEVATAHARQRQCTDILTAKVRDVRAGVDADLADLRAFKHHVATVASEVLGELRIARDSTSDRSIFEQVADELRKRTASQGEAERGAAQERKESAARAVEEARATRERTDGASADGRLTTAARSAGEGTPSVTAENPWLDAVMDGNAVCAAIPLERLKLLGVGAVSDVLDAVAKVARADAARGPRTGGEG